MTSSMGRSHGHSMLPQRTRHSTRSRGHSAQRTRTTTTHSTAHRHSTQHTAHSAAHGHSMLPQRTRHGTRSQRTAHSTQRTRTAAADGNSAWTQRSGGGGSGRARRTRGSKATARAKFKRLEFLAVLNQGRGELVEKCGNQEEGCEQKGENADDDGVVQRACERGRGGRWTVSE